MHGVEDKMKHKLFFHIFLKIRNLTIIPVICGILLAYSCENAMRGQYGKDGFSDPPREFSVMPFWFWNDSLCDDVIIQQIADFEAHGVYGFVIHPRIGLPENITWLSAEMIHYMRTAIVEASKRKMYVILYDEGMYPSGSSSGQVVATNPGFAARGLAKIVLYPGDSLRLPSNARLVAINQIPDGSRTAIIEKPSGGIIRGLHYTGEGSGHPGEESPPAGDILNPAAVNCFINLVYDKYANEFGDFFGSTITGIFTDEPSPLGRNSEKGMIPGNAEIIPMIDSITGYDIRPFLSELWITDSIQPGRHYKDYYRALNICLGKIYYERLSSWCKRHGIALMGHPALSMDIGSEKYFQVPGQDIVWRYVEPGSKAIEGPNSTVAKCASSAMLNNGDRRNSDELYGAYGHDLTWDEMLWLANWCFSRGQNLLIPHAFFFSVRGPRYDERPPDVGPNSKWWDRYKLYADACRRLSWINTDSRPVCSVAILANETFLPVEPAKILLRNQVDFNYLEFSHLWNDAVITDKTLHVGEMDYRVLILDSSLAVPEKAMPVLNELYKNDLLVFLGSSPFLCEFGEPDSSVKAEQLTEVIRKYTGTDIILNPPSRSIRCRHVIKGPDNYYLLFNEEDHIVKTFVSVSAKGRKEQWLDQFSGKITEAHDQVSGSEQIIFQPFEMKVLLISQ
jgi:hypothetical protein